MTRDEVYKLTENELCIKANEFAQGVSFVETELRRGTLFGCDNSGEWHILQNFGNHLGLAWAWLANKAVEMGFSVTLSQKYLGRHKVTTCVMNRPDGTWTAQGSSAAQTLTRAFVYMMSNQSEE